MDSWLVAAAASLAQEAKVPHELLELDDGTANELLALAGLAAHRSGVRTNAPLLCFLVGLTVGRSGAELAALVRAVDQSGS